MKIIPKAQSGTKLDKEYINESTGSPVYVDNEGYIRDYTNSNRYTVQLPQVTKEAYTYRTANDPLGGLDFINEAIFRPTSVLSPTSWIGAARHANDGGNFVRSLFGTEENLGIVGKEFSKEHPLISFGINFTGDLATPFAIGGVKSLATNVARRFPYRLNIPVSSDKYYRIVGMDAVDDANKSGLIRWQPTSNNTLQDNNLSGKSLLDKLDVGSRSGGVPYFTKGKLYMPPESGQAVIVGNSSIPWKRIGSKGRINRYSQEDPIRIGNSATPYINGQFNTASTGVFEYWTRGNNFITKHFYKRHNFDSGADYTNRLLQLLGNSKSNRNLGTFNYITQQFADYLQSRGVDISKFSSDDLLRLQSIRRKSLLQSSPDSEYITVQQGGTTTPQTSYTLRSQNHTDLADMEMIGNRVGKLEAIQPGHQSSEKLYNAGIRLNPKGIISGDLLLSPEITYNIWKKFPDKRIIGKQGIHTFNYGRDVIKKGNSYTIHNGNQVLLKSPTNLILPIKSESTFDPTIIDVFNYKLKFPNWYDSNIYK